ncbi:MAG TPA: hypothetical protein VKF82_10115 [Candidatus Eremiobacteraceae bacterium]|nr:hypothetical protein [Candidatus Eremiobacteraceae bacterium]
MRAIVLFAAALAALGAPVVAVADDAASAPASTPVPASTPASGDADDAPGSFLFTLGASVRPRYYFQAMAGGKARAQYRITLGTKLSGGQQLSVNVPLVTSYQSGLAPKSGLGNVSIVYAFPRVGRRSDHTLSAEIELPTVTNDVKSNDTQLRPHYDFRLYSERGGVLLQNTFVQSISVPPGSSWSSYYDLKAQPYVESKTSGSLSLFYEARVNLALGGVYVSALGPSVVGRIGRRFSVSAFDIWGLGANSQNLLWRYKVQALLSATL